MITMRHAGNSSLAILSLVPTMDSTQHVSSTDCSALVADLVIDSRRQTTGRLSDWVARFTELWAAPAGRLEEIMDLLSPDVRLAAPGYRTTVGRAAGLRAFTRTLHGMPDLRADIHGWAARRELTADSAAMELFIAMTFSATIGGRLVSWSSVDHLTFRSGYAVQRVAYFDPTPVRAAFLRGPAGWRQYRRLRRLDS